MLKLLLLFVCLLLSVQADEILKSTAKTKGITPKDLAIIGNRTYYISPSTTMVNVLDALSLCNDFGMQLVSLETDQEIALVKEYITVNGSVDASYWTSGREVLGSYYWTSTGRLFTDTNWLDGEPDGTPGECVRMQGGDTWTDVNCAADFSFICEK